MIISNGIQGQTTQTPLDQLKLNRQFNGTWQADYGKDTVDFWDSQPYGKVNIITVSWIIKGQKTPHYINNVSFNSNEDKFYGFALWPSGGRTTWIGSYVSETKYSGEFYLDFNPEKVLGKFEMIYESPSAFTWRQFNMEGATLRDLKYKKVK